MLKQMIQALEMSYAATADRLVFLRKLEVISDGEGSSPPKYRYKENGYTYDVCFEQHSPECFVEATKEGGKTMEIFRQTKKCCILHLIHDATGAVERHIAIKNGKEIPNPTSPWKH